MRDQKPEGRGRKRESGGGWSLLKLSAPVTGSAAVSAALGWFAGEDVGARGRQTGNFECGGGKRAWAVNPCVRPGAPKRRSLNDARNGSGTRRAQRDLPRENPEVAEISHLCVPCALCGYPSLVTNN